MSRLRHFLRACFLFASHQAWCPKPEWTNDDARAWTAFLRSPAGVKLNALIENTIMDANASATHKADRFACGWACGYRGLVANLQSLTVVGPEPDITEGADKGADAFAHLQP